VSRHIGFLCLNNTVPLSVWQIYHTSQAKQSRPTITKGKWALFAESFR